MSSCLSGAGRAYRIDSLALEIIKSPSSSSWISNSSSPSSTLFESSNCPLAISTRKPRTPRKRPNQTYNEAAAILSSAHPKIFPTKPSSKFTKSHHHNKNQLLFEPSDLLVPFQIVHHSGFLLDSSLLQTPAANLSLVEPKGFDFNPCQSPWEIKSSEIHHGSEEDFDAKSILDEEIGMGIESIIGNLDLENESFEDNCNSSTQMNNTFCYGYPVGLGFDFGYGMRREMRAMRNDDEYNWWRFPSVNVLDITPTIAKIPSEKKKKTKNKVEKGTESTRNSIMATKQNLTLKSPGEESAVPQPNAGLLLKLDYDSVLNEWSNKGSPFSGDSPVSQSAGNDVQGRFVRTPNSLDDGR